MAPTGDSGHLDDAARRVEDAFESVAHRAEARVQKESRDAGALLGRHPRAAGVAQLARAVLDEQSAEQVGLAASGAAFWLVISAFPTAAAVVSLFGLVVSPHHVANDLGSLVRAAPASLGSVLSDQLQRLAAADRGGLSVRLGVSLVLAVWSASAGVYNIDRAIRYAFGLPPQRYVDARARALGGALVVVVVLGAIALLASVVGTRVPAFVIAAVVVPATFVALAVGIATLYRFSIGQGVSTRQLLPGAVFAAAAVVVSLAAFSTYLALSTNLAAVYGAFAGVVIGMVGTYLASYGLLLGAVLNAQLLHAPEGAPIAPSPGDRTA